MIEGLKPYAEYKESGLPWLGQIPSNWHTVRNGSLFSQRNETNYPQLPILEVSLRTGVRVRNFETSNRKQLMSDFSKYKRAVAGDIAYNMMRMWQGAVGVTRGLDPNVPLKPSGVPWLGDIPKHWEVRRLGSIAKSFKTGPFGTMLHQQDYVTEGIPVINPIHLSAGSITPNPNCSISPTTQNRLYDYRLSIGDVVFSRRGELGRCALVGQREAGWLLGTGCIRMTLVPNSIDNQYLIAALQARWVGLYLSFMSVGATMESLNTDILKGLPLLLPPHAEQIKIPSTIIRDTRSVTTVIARTEREIALMQEYRTRLTADVVTGKLDVREAAAKLPDVREFGKPADEVSVNDVDDDEVNDSL